MVLEHEVTEPEVKILEPSRKECTNKKDKVLKKTLVCVASGFYPDHVTMSWQINGNDTNNGVATDNYAQKYGKYYRITSRLRVNGTDWEKPNNVFKCIVSFYNGTDYSQHEDTIDGVRAKTRLGITRGKFLKVSQNGKLCYGVFIVKSCIYGAFVTFLVWKLQSSVGKKNC